MPGNADQHAPVLSILCCARRIHVLVDDLLPGGLGFAATDDHRRLLGAYQAWRLVLGGLLPTGGWRLQQGLQDSPMLVDPKPSGVHCAFPGS